MSSNGSQAKEKLRHITMLSSYILVVSGFCLAKEPTPNLYLDVPAPILSQWNMDNVLTVDDTVDGFSGATAKSYIYRSKADADLATIEGSSWDDNSVAYVTWELDNGTGRAPGIQVLNDNLDYKFHNCIMASGEIELPSFPDAAVPKACNDPQGSSKRYFLQLTETDTPIDLSFDLDVKSIRYKGLIDENDDTEENGSSGESSKEKDNTIQIYREKYGVGRIYRVIQKIRNDTDKRVVSYKFELGTGIGDDFQPLNFEEHGVGFEMRELVPREFFDGRTGAAPDVEVWKTERFATFAPKMFDSGERVRFSPGFLDHQAAGFMSPYYELDTNWKTQFINSGLWVEDDIVGSLTKNFFDIGATHNVDFPGNMLGYMLPNNQVPTVIAYYLTNDVHAESYGVLAIWDGENWRSGRAGLDGDPETTEDNFAPIPLEQLQAWAEKPLGLTFHEDDSEQLIRYAAIPSDDLAGINTDIFIHISEKLLNEANEPIFDSLTLRITARSIEDILPGIRGSEDPLWPPYDECKENQSEDGTYANSYCAPELATYKVPDDVLEAFEDYATTDEKTSVRIDVLSNDLFNGTSILETAFTLEIAEEPANGTLILNEDSTFNYTPAWYFKGYDVFKYQITTTGNDEYLSVVANVKVLVNPELVLGSPVILSDNVMMVQSSSTIIDVLDNDMYDEGKKQVMSIKIHNQPKNGEVSINEELQIVYIPNPYFVGIEQFTYSVSEDDVESNTAVVTVRVDEPIVDDFVEEDIYESGGGCTIGHPDTPIDTTLLLITLAALIRLQLRNRKTLN
ncbi:choice-of-anchor F family protein [Vibrio sp. SCSIO 43140]|uniref:choice-of-anchor F family protein n=1 Tax=Vibrio sp. SCSIO 43140 TaxID=2819100 RepID=UPI002075CABF|nr:choice-of-anchor F family protein [Vibrio sp. SCSIO 43140]USD63664.1 choice-of-anchor F family protein [Vibrio sp. SCSIO 43140]